MRGTGGSGADTQKTRVIFVKTGESNSNACYEARFGSLYEPIFVGVLRTEVDRSGVEDGLAKLLLLERSEAEQTPRFDGVVLTSARAVLALQQAIRHIVAAAAATLLLVALRYLCLCPCSRCRELCGSMTTQRLA